MHKIISPVRPLISVFMLAGSVYLSQAAHAGEGAGLMRQMQQANPGLSNREIRRIIHRDVIARPVTDSVPSLSFPVSKDTTPQTIGANNSVNSHMENRLQKLSDQSAFIRDNGRAKAVVNGIELDLTSSDRTIVLGKNLFIDSATHSIKVGSEEKTLSSGDRVTAAEYIALQQVLNEGSQGLNVDANGRGVGGEFSLNSINDGGKTIRANQLVIPEFVTASGDFSKHSDGIRVTNDLINFGSVNAFSTDKQFDTARIAARDITNNSGATIRTSAEQLNLSLHADRDINNSGLISASGNLEITAGRAINNTGSIISDQNITLSGTADSDLSVANAGGTILAQNGAINIRSEVYSGTGNTTVYGGDLISRELNLFTGMGTTDVFVNQLTGVVNSTGSAAHVRANTAMLTIGTQCLIGDPTYYNTGDISLTGDITVGEKLAIIASGDIIRAGLNNIRAVDANGVGQDITIIAGANIVSGTTPSSTVPGTAATGAVTIDGASATGGNISLSGINLRIESNGTNQDTAGGDITIAAYADSNGNKGTINLGAGLIDSSGVGENGRNGAINIIAGGNGTAITIGAAVISSGGTNNNGGVTIATAQPAFSSGTSMTFDTTGAITSGNTIVPSADINPSGGIQINQSITTVGGDVLIHGGTQVTLSSTVITDGTPGGGTINAGDISIISDSGRVLAQNLLRAQASPTADGGNITVRGHEDITKLTVIGAITAGKNGGDILIENSGTGGVFISGIVSEFGDKGSITINSSGLLEFGGGGVTLSSDGSGLSTDTQAGRISLSSTNLMISGTTNISANESTPSLTQDAAVSISTSSGGISTNGNTLNITSSGDLNLDIATNAINANSSTTNGGTVSLSANSITNNQSTPLTPLVITANGANNGNGGSISYTDQSTKPTYVGVPSKTPKGEVAYLQLSAHAGPNNGNGGSVTVDVNGDLTVDVSAIDVASSAGGGAHNGGNITLKAGAAPSNKVGKLVVLGDLNVDGVNGGNSGTIQLSSAYTKAFTVGGTKAPKNGVQGSLSAAGSSISIESGNGITLLAMNSINSANVSLEASGKGKISASKGVVLTGDNLHLVSDTGSISLNTQATTLDAFTNSSLTINNDSSNLGIPIGQNVTANGGVDITNTGNITYQTVRVLTKGSVNLVSENGGISSNSGSQIIATSGGITLQAKSTTTGSIWTANGGSMRTFGGKKAGNIVLAIGELPKKPTTPVPSEFTPPAEIIVVNNGKGQTYFGENPTAISSDGSAGPTTFTANDKKIILNNQSSTGQGIDFSGNNQIVTNSPI
ncbi:S-layer family protein [Candidatus Obscuribacterales bacterium]|nr:S-layer family protein [Candidatus Obscuribacterales bacterium]